MKKSGILNPELARHLAMLGHLDKFCIADAGLPIPVGVPRIDLALVKDVPLVQQVLEALQRELVVQEVTTATETRVHTPAFLQLTSGLWPEAAKSELSHVDFKKMLADCRFVVRTGEFTPYANVILVSGAPF